jgi:hypothetical protein
MISPSSRAFPLRLWAARGRLVCLLALPHRFLAPPGFARHLVVIASPTAPRLRRLMVYRRLAASPDDSPQAA